MPTANQARKTAPSPFQLVAGHPVLDFVNTLDWRFRSTGLVKGGGDWQMLLYGQAVHAFTDKTADSHGVCALAYHELTDNRLLAVARRDNVNSIRF